MRIRSQNENWEGKAKYSEKTSPSAILSNINDISPDMGSHPGNSGGKLATNSLTHVTALQGTVIREETTPQEQSTQ
jgi:hypothetical protein